MYILPLHPRAPAAEPVSHLRPDASSARIKLLFVCDFCSIHARLYIGYFARRGGEFEIVVLSTRKAAEMDGVRLINVATTSGHHGSGPTLARRVFDAAYPVLVRFPRLYNWIWSRELRKAAAVLRQQVRDVVLPFTPHIVHAHRLQPEGIIALDLMERFADVPLFATIWGQDLVLFADSEARLGALTRKVLGATRVLLPDNSRDARIARGRYGLAASAETIVIPASGGIYESELAPYAKRSEDLPALAGSPRLLTARGFEGGYNRLRPVMQAHALLLRTHPDAVLHIVAPNTPHKRRAVRRWAREMRIQHRIELVDLRRPDLMAYMQACDINVFATRTDGLSMSLLESMYFGQIPVIPAHECYSPPLEAGVNCEMFPVESDPVEIAHALRRAIDSRVSRSDRQARNRETLREYCDPERNLAVVAERYRRLART